jgi:uncharacterized protein YbjT (DUF2867 family)
MPLARNKETRFMSDRTTLVIGGTGKTGRRVAERLWGRGLPVRLGSRSTDLRFDWNDPGTWRPALTGVHAAYVSYHPDLAIPGTADVIRALADTAVAAGVRKLVLLSGRGEPEAQRCEQAIRDSGAAWTIVRASGFCQNFSEGYLLEPILDGEIALPAGDVGEPFVDAEDVAAVAVAALSDDRHDGQEYEVTGPRLLSFAEAVAAIGAASGRQLHYVHVDIDDYVAALSAAQVPADVVALIRYLFTDVLDGRNASVQDGVRRALNRPPRDFADYARVTAASGVWHPRQLPRRGSEHSVAGAALKG